MPVRELELADYVGAVETIYNAQPPGDAAGPIRVVATDTVRAEFGRHPMMDVRQNNSEGWRVGVQHSKTFSIYKRHYFIPPLEGNQNGDKRIFTSGWVNYPLGGLFSGETGIENGFRTIPRRALPESHKPILWDLLQAAQVKLGLIQ